MAEDEPVARRMLEGLLANWDYGPVPVVDGIEAWDRLRSDPALRIALLDRMMPGLDGVEICRKAREEIRDRPLCLILCTARTQTGDLVDGLEAGADDYLPKPVRSAELGARLRVGARAVALESALHERIAELRDALAHVERLQGLLPICMHCKSIRTSADVWQRIEDYLTDHSDVRFSHGLCDRCIEEKYGAVLPSPMPADPS